jgi:hypothetical protein
MSRASAQARVVAVNSLGLRFVRSPRAVPPGTALTNAALSVIICVAAFALGYMVGDYLGEAARSTGAKAFDKEAS